MYYLSEIIKESLKKLNSEKERDLLRYLKSEKIKEIEQEFLKNFLEIEHKISTDIINENFDYTIYTLPVSYEEYTAIEEYFFPLYKEELKKYNGNKVKKILTIEIGKAFRQIYLNTEYFHIEKFKHKIFKGKIKIQNKEYSINIKVRQTEKYLEKEKEVLRVFNLNKLDWKVQNNLYSRRFFELYIKDLPEEIRDKELSNIEIDYEEYQNEVYENYFLTWNITEKDILLDKLRNDTVEKYINKAKIYSNESSSDLIWISNGQIFKIERYDTYIYIYTDEEPDNEWKLWNIRDIGSLEKYRELNFKPEGNRREKDFITELKIRNGKRLRSEAEIFEVVNNFIELKNLKLEKIKLNGYVENSITPYNANYIFDKTVTLKREKKDILYLYFSVKDKKDKYLYDRMSFLLSSIEYLYPEFKVKGVLEWR